MANPVAFYTNVGRLTTTFIPSPTCFDYELIPATEGLDDKVNIKLRGQPECFPDRFSLKNVLTTAAYYSPGRCPASYTPYRVEETIQNVQTVGPGITATSLSGEHIYLCCPRFVILRVVVYKSTFAICSA